MSHTQQRLKYVATINDEALGEDTNGDFEMKYVDISNVYSTGSIGELAMYKFEEAPSRARRRVRDGDVIISTVRTYLQAIAQVQDPPENLIVSTGFAVIRPRREVLDARYCKYALREPEFLAEVERRSVGVSYPAINASDLGGIPVHVHPLSRQRALADYLDRETARIDALIEAKKRVTPWKWQRRAQDFPQESLPPGNAAKLSLRCDRPSTWQKSTIGASASFLCPNRPRLRH